MCSAVLDIILTSLVRNGNVSEIRTPNLMRNECPKPIRDAINMRPITDKIKDKKLYFYVYETNRGRR